MVDAKSEPSNILPHNPLTNVGVLGELKKLKGDKPWIQFELELLCTQFPTNASFKMALEKITSKIEIEKPWETEKQPNSPTHTKQAPVNPKSKKTVKKAQAEAKAKDEGGNHGDADGASQIK